MQLLQSQHELIQSQQVSLNNLEFQMDYLLNAFNNRSEDNIPSDANDNLGSDTIVQFSVVIPKAKELEVKCPLEEVVHDLTMKNVNNQFCD